MKSADWLPLFKFALKILSQEKVLKSQWSFGGGTALMTYYNHRKSKDIDIFLRDVQLLTKFTPRLNDYVAEQTDDYTEMSNSLKLKVKEQEIDFIVAPLLTKTPTLKKIVGNTPIYIETPEEIVIKKIFYRADAFKTRDVFDLAVVIKHKENSLLENLDIFQSKIDVLLNRLNILKKIYAIELKSLDIIDSQTAKDSLKIVQEFINKLIH
ncbi:MAG: hypothetical protein C4550_01030 [Nitrospiraceae bacterium]|nr:MAG: hypothetical protein C4550_01030 [Nitrospiraceae bacterium]